MDLRPYIRDDAYAVTPPSDELPFEYVVVDATLRAVGLAVFWYSTNQDRLRTDWLDPPRWYALGYAAPRDRLPPAARRRLPAHTRRVVLDGVDYVVWDEARAYDEPGDDIFAGDDGGSALWDLEKIYHGPSRLGFGNPLRHALWTRMVHDVRDVRALKTAPRFTAYRLWETVAKHYQRSDL